MKTTTNNKITNLNSTALKDLVVYAPNNHPAPERYIKLVNTMIMRVDKQGQPRPLEDLLYFLQVCKNANLDPTLKQIYAVYRWDKYQKKEVMSIQAGIDGLRLSAERTGLYAGSDDPKIEKSGNKIVQASVTVYKINKITGERMPSTSSAFWSNYYPKNPKLTRMWESMPEVMISKCAEAQALRKTFPVLSNIYAPEEMQQAKEEKEEDVLKLEKNEIKLINACKKPEQLIKVCRALNKDKGPKFRKIIIEAYTNKKGELEI